MNSLSNPEIDRFRSEVRDFIRTNLPDDVRAMVAEERMDLPKEPQRRWHRILAKQGWGCPSWPRSHGGAGWSDAQHYVFEREIALADAPRPMIYGVSMFAPTLIKYGTEQQKAEILPRIRNADDFWCQGYSEPGAGSDLASLKCRADRKGDIYVLNGSKLWTSEAHIADRMFGIFRTDSSGKKQYGITFMVLDMASPGIEVVPVKTFDGSGPEVNQVFFTNVEVPVANRIGEEHQGWTVAKYLLSLERFGTAEVSRSLKTIERLKTFFASQHNMPAQDPHLMDRLYRAEISLRALELTEIRLLFSGTDPGPESSMLKLRGTEIQNDLMELIHDAVGPYATLSTGEDAVATLSAIPAEAAFAARAHFNYRKTLIYAGSSEIQHNIIAKAVLGL